MRQTNTLLIIALALLSVSMNVFAKTADIGVAAIAVESELVGKGEFKPNDNISEGDAVTTGTKRGTTTILFNDESMLTLGPGARATVEIYNEGGNGKPGRSVIRVHQGQFRYFPGDILEKGGAQFIAVGKNILGKSNIAPGTISDNTSGQTSDSSKTSISVNGKKNDNIHTDGTLNDSTSTGDNNSGAVDSAQQETPTPDDNSGNGGSGNNNVKPGGLIVAGTGLNTNNDGAIPTSTWICPSCLGGLNGAKRRYMAHVNDFVISGTVEGDSVTFDYLGKTGKPLVGLNGDSLSGSFSLGDNDTPSRRAPKVGAIKDSISAPTYVPPTTITPPTTVYVPTTFTTPTTFVAPPLVVAPPPITLPTSVYQPPISSTPTVAAP